jgi:hypothetical protein
MRVAKKMPKHNRKRGSGKHGSMMMKKKSKKLGGWTSG